MQTNRPVDTLTVKIIMNDAARPWGRSWMPNWLGGDYLAPASRVCDQTPR